MHRFILWLGFIFVFLFIADKSYAQVVLNEIFSNPENEEEEFIELYNNFDYEVDLSNWKINDLVKSFTITDQKISPKSFLVFEKSTTGIALNNSNEEVSLIDLNNLITDKFSYETTFENTTWSRAPDGIGEFSNNTPVTKGYENLVPPTSTPTITPTNYPTNTPKPAKLPTSTPTPILKTSPKLSPTINPSPTQKKLERKTPTITLISVKGVSDSKEGDINKVDEVLTDEEEKKPMYLYSLSTGVGMLILGCGILLFKKFKKTNEEDDF